MAKLKTKPTGRSVTEFLAGIADDRRRKECRTVAKIMRRATGQQPKMWGDGIVGYGRYHYRYASGREGDWFLSGFSPRKQALTIYIMAGFSRYQSLMKKLGKYKAGSSCLYIANLDDVDLDVLEELIERSAAHMAKQQA